MYKKINTPLTEEVIKNLKAGDTVLITGRIFTARDAAHKRMIELLNNGQDMPVDIKNQVIYYVGPCPAKPGQAVGSCGPTTSGRMDAYTPKLLEIGLKGMIGKGYRSQEVIDAMMKYHAVYFTAIGGAGALLSERVIESKVVAYDDLGPEAIHEFTVEDFPVIVTIDMYGNNLYESEKEKYRK
ncbi:Fe-S-containing hydro-lyase [Thermoanaerobacterium thermosaccharolyticum]|uniref:Fe-S-containing hydro-lyase n=1 Tax=Thermoanaerobacterium thermosaccharolyticum TaxID=1517 RepID=UPI00177D1A81|nr:Fe-S-containing hydro-lyase [Thermoanaerobacterium thermosaccharolyticum]MBE0067896.1 Fe-S-containing hydro-lyase [Thermoanaerobacterium thermosaccharolyticum]MBE0227459.1 Fe-S-containing hydro-lyase [Thermoanaerobacterium thermosaccharolyticum]